MRHSSPKTYRRRSQQGYAILMVLFFVTLLLIAAMSVAPNILTQGRREKEAEMIWRGKQYVRGIKFFYRKTGKFPTSLDDLTKPHVGNIRFMRQAYKDPMNAKGEWRLIYVGPAGQLIGSLNPRRSLQMNAFGGATGQLPGALASQVAAQSLGQNSNQGFGQGFGQSLNQAAGQVFGNAGGLQPPNSPTSGNSSNAPVSASAAGQQNPPNGSEPSAPTGQATSAGTNSPDSAVSDAANEALLNAEPATVIGGNIIGVGSTINQRSVTVYEKAKNYKQFEFIWDPSKDPITFGGATGPQIGTPAGTLGNPTGQPLGTSPGQNPINPNNPNGPLNPPPNPPETTPNSPQQP